MPVARRCVPPGVRVLLGLQCRVLQLSRLQMPARGAVCMPQHTVWDGWTSGRAEGGGQARRWWRAGRRDGDRCTSRGSVWVGGGSGRGGNEHRRRYHCTRDRNFEVLAILNQTIPVKVTKGGNEAPPLPPASSSSRTPWFSRVVVARSHSTCRGCLGSPSWAW